MTGTTSNLIPVTYKSGAIQMLDKCDKVSSSHLKWRARHHRISARLQRIFRGDPLSQFSSSDLASDLRTYVGGRRDSKKESDLLRRLRALPQRERLALLTPLLDLKVPTALLLISRAQLSRTDYLEIFKRGLVDADASSIALWMDATVPHIGWRLTFSILRQCLATNPRRGASALYQVPWVCRGKGQLSGGLPTRELTAEFVRLVVQYQEKGHRVVDDSTLAIFKKRLSCCQEN